MDSKGNSSTLGLSGSLEVGVDLLGWSGAERKTPALMSLVLV